MKSNSVPAADGSLWMALFSANVLSGQFSSACVHGT